MDRNSYRRPTKSKQSEDEGWEVVEERKRLPKWLAILPPPMRKIIGSPFLTLALVCTVLYFVINHTQTSSSETKKNSYRGKQFWNPAKTIAVKTLYETPFATMQIHTVQAGTDVIDDWLWCDEMNHINALVHEAETGKFIIFRQTKYGIPGPPTLALVGGLIESGEEPLEAAKREVLEELQMESNDWVSLGTYRVAANRGGGIASTFLAKNATVVASSKVSSIKGQADLERQDIVKCTEDELLEYVLNAEFGEIKWAATAAFALLKLRS